MRALFIVLWMLFGAVTSAMSQVSVGVGIALPGVSIGISVPAYPEFVRVPGYPVYYAPRLPANFFFYDGLYWVYIVDTWYVSFWYNGPWRIVVPEAVPVYVLRIPVRYYRDPPGYFRGWRRDAPPRWNEHWGREWEQRRRGWDHWNRRAAPAPAPLPAYQRRYSGDRYPREEQQQQALHGQNYRYRPRDAAVRQHYPEQATPRAPAQREPQAAPPQRSPRQREREREQDRQRFSPPAQPQQARPGDHRRSEPQLAAPGREQHAPSSRQEERPQGKGTSQAQKRKQGQDKDRGKDEE